MGAKVALWEKASRTRALLVRSGDALEDSEWGFDITSDLGGGEDGSELDDGCPWKFLGI